MFTYTSTIFGVPCQHKAHLQEGGEKQDLLRARVQAVQEVQKVGGQAQGSQFTICHRCDGVEKPHVGHQQAAVPRIQIGLSRRLWFARAPVTTHIHMTAQQQPHHRKPGNKDSFAGGGCGLLRENSKVQEYGRRKEKART